MDIGMKTETFDQRVTFGTGMRVTSINAELQEVQVTHRRPDAVVRYTFLYEVGDTEPLEEDLVVPLDEDLAIMFTIGQDAPAELREFLIKQGKKIAQATFEIESSSID